MGVINLVKNLWRYNSLDEEIKSFARKGDSAISDKQLINVAGEGYEYAGGPISAVGLSSFNMFYDNYVNRAFKNEVDKIYNYRNMAQMPEIADVVEDAVIESTQEDLDGKILQVQITDEELRKNENIVTNIEQEFELLFYNRIKISNIISDLLRTYYVDGRLFYERLINRTKPGDGIMGIKKLPTETMDFEYDPKTLKITRVFQYLKESAKRPDPKETEKEGVVIFHPEQIGFIDYGVYGKNRYDIIGFLDKAKIPYNQLKLLETSVIIYRIVRAPERLVYKIDVGQMPREKAIKYVEEQKNRMMKRPTYDPQTGSLTNAPEIFCIKHDTEIPLLDGRTLTLDDIINEFKSGKTNWVYSLNRETHKIEPGKIINADITRLNEPMVRVWLDNGEYVDTTYDHKFILRNGDDCRADELKINDGLMSLYKKRENLSDYKTAVNHKVVKIEYLEEKANCGCITVEGNNNFACKCGIFINNSILDNIFIPVSSEGGRGSDVTTVGGNPSGFTELADINYFQRKLYKALKYPMSRVTAMETHQESSILFSNSPVGEIARDEIKWATFLSRHQTRFCDEMQKLFLLHLEFKGLKKQYDLDDSKINIALNPPSFFKERQEQLLRETRFANYLALANQPEMGRSFLMERYLDFTEEEIQANADAIKADIKYGFREAPMEEIQSAPGTAPEDKPIKSDEE